jgi:uncharacterized metal-binding protein
MTAKSSCGCGGTVKLVFPCSGASDTGEIADRAARKISSEGTGNMYCLAGIGGRVSGIMATTKAACRVLAIDGCPIACAKKTLEAAGFSGFHHIRLNDLGMEKGESPVVPERIEKVAEAARKLLA